MPSLLNETLQLRINGIRYSLEVHQPNIGDLEGIVEFHRKQLEEAKVKYKGQLDLIAALEALKEPEPDALPR